MAQEHAATLATAGWFDQAVFGYYPYIALAVLAIGSIIRFDREPYTWRSGSSQLLRRKQLMLGSVLFHVGVLIIFGGHFVGLLTPIEVFDAIGVSHGAKQVLAIIADRFPAIVFEFFEARIYRERDGSDRHFDPIPFRLHHLQGPLSREPAMLLDAARRWHSHEPLHHEFRGGRSIASAWRRPLPSLTVDVPQWMKPHVPTPTRCCGTCSTKNRARGAGG